MKKIAVITTGWYFPLHFYQALASQKILEGWSVDLFCVSHRDPAYSEREKKESLNLGYSRRELFDRLLYRKIATVPQLEAIGWKYTLEPNTMGDWSIANQWLEKHDYREYEKLLFTHDDNYILTDRLFVDLLPQEDWLILTNSTGHSQRRLRQWLYLPKPFIARGSFEFFTREAMDRIGGSFDLSRTKLTRVGQFDTPDDFKALSDWNESDRTVHAMVEKAGLLPRVKFLSQYYRMSRYCLEGERGFIHLTEKSNTKEEEKGLDEVEQYYAAHPDEALPPM